MGKRNKIVSFCTTCANRVHQLERTFDANLKIIVEHPNTEWIIVNFGSQDTLDEFIIGRLPEAPRRVSYVRDLSHSEWHLSIAKNVAHRLASGDILVNLDCDNFIGTALDAVLESFSKDTPILHLWSGKFRDGSCGRIAIAKNVFLKIGGYDESFLPMGYQDLDLLNRARAAGFKVKQVSSAAGSAIQNSKDMPIKGHSVQSSWQQFNSINRKMSDSNIKAGFLTANRGRKWGNAKVEIMHGKKRI